MKRPHCKLALFSLTVVLAACGVERGEDSRAQAAEPTAEAGAPASQADKAFAIEPHGTFDEPWAMTFLPGTSLLIVTEKAGTIAGYDTATGRRLAVTGAPKVAYGGQGGLGDVAFLASEAADALTPRTIYLSWAEQGAGDTRGAVVGKGTLTCAANGDCTIGNLTVIWRQTPKVSGRGHYSHRLTFSPDGKYLFIASGDRQKMTPAQDLSNTLGTIVRLTPDGKAAADNPFATHKNADPAIWSYGHRNILGLRFDAQGRLWDLEHGPAGGDELNLVEPGKNYGWPVVSNGNHYDGKPIPDHATRPEFAAPAISWTPVIAPGDFLFYAGALFPQWKGNALIPGLESKALVRVTIDGTRASEQARYDFGKRLRAIAEAPDGALWVAEDGKDARLLRLTPRP
ncbi:putative aldose sugar dehydrogenase [Caenibius tardaugens NBRC 16725]|uniref:Putative aldose sugar dehydrogenase n=1 Tax=Caenibius tardaugens NBRC 16725 TaxID=1219035 RepID=U2YIY8_9SPHN|nr:PQQ-dependent sugar dehydrogenase [Caenibius tardaugens]AZI34621.1 PQQ-dependent sugar dehydrogenase [Caenibius tardaugens NBRC 16725]GAD48127.1 putative aldose sugar dehydrogenase [Caenibius tardaugens NBRC 16725]